MALPSQEELKWFSMVKECLTLPPRWRRYSQTPWWARTQEVHLGHVSFGEFFNPDELHQKHFLNSNSFRIIHNIIEDVAFSSHTDGGKLKYTAPSTMQIHNSVYEKFQDFDTVDYEVSLLDYDAVT